MIEKHPYGDYVPQNPKAMIIGSFPIGKFSNPKRRKDILSHEYDFYFGGEKNLLWKLLGQTFEHPIKSKEDIIELLEDIGLGIGDVIRSCKRKNGGGSDSALYDIKWNTDLLTVIDRHEIQTLYFTGKKVREWFDRLFPHSDHLEKIDLISPSAQVYRSLGKLPSYQKWKLAHPNSKSYDFILAEYKKAFSRMRGKGN